MLIVINWKKYSHVKSDYSSIMDKLRIVSLSVRRRMYDACVLHGLINGNIDSPYLVGCLFFLLPAVYSRATRNKYILQFKKEQYLNFWFLENEI